MFVFFVFPFVCRFAVLTFRTPIVWRVLRFDHWNSESFPRFPYAYCTSVCIAVTRVYVPHFSENSAVSKLHETRFSLRLFSMIFPNIHVFVPFCVLSFHDFPSVVSSMFVFTELLRIYKVPCVPTASLTNYTCFKTLLFFLVMTLVEVIVFDNFDSSIVF